MKSPERFFVSYFQANRLTHSLLFLFLSLARIGRSWWVFRRVRRLGKCLCALSSLLRPWFPHLLWASLFKAAERNRHTHAERESKTALHADLKDFIIGFWCAAGLMKEETLRLLRLCESTFCPVCLESKLMTPPLYSSHSLRRPREFVLGNDHSRAWWVLQRVYDWSIQSALIRTKGY